MDVKIKSFDSVQDVIRCAVENRCYSTSNDREDFYGDETADQAIQHGLTGNDSLVSKAEQIMDKININVESMRPSWERGHAGMFPIVPAYLAGDPQSMMNRVMTESDMAPLSLYVNLVSSQGVTPEKLEQRGIAIRALAMSLVKIRPLNLHLYYSCSGVGDRSKGNNVLICRVNTTPLDLATAAWSLTSQGFARRVCMWMTSRYVAETKSEFKEGATVSWPEGYDAPLGVEYGKRLGAILSPTERFLNIPGVHWKDTTFDDPQRWVLDRIDEINKVD